MPLSNPNSNSSCPARKEKVYSEYVAPTLRNMRSFRMRFQRKEPMELPQGMEVLKPASALLKLNTSLPKYPDKNSWSRSLRR